MTQYMRLSDSAQMVPNRWIWTFPINWFIYTCNVLGLGVSVLIRDCTLLIYCASRDQQRKFQHLIIVSVNHALMYYATSTGAGHFLQLLSKTHRSWARHNQANLTSNHPMDGDLFTFCPVTIDKLSFFVHVYYHYGTMQCWIGVVKCSK